MTALYGYEILTNKDKYPMYLEARKTILLNRKPYYKWYIEVREYDMYANEYYYYILFSNTKFNEKCKPVKYDDYGRTKIKVTIETHKEIKYLIEHNNKFNLEYIESTEEYDKYMIN